MLRAQKREFVNPTGLKPVLSIVLAIVRMALGSTLLYYDPLSPVFRYLLIALFAVSVTRHLVFYFGAPIPDNVYNFLLDLVTPCLYGFILYHVLSVYHADLLWLSISVFLPAIMYIFLFAREVPMTGKSVFWSGLLGYVLTFLLALNYMFDFSSPVVEKYLLTDKYYVPTLSDDEAATGDSYYFDLIRIDSLATSAQWVEVNRQIYQRYSNSWMYKRINFEDSGYIILDKKETPYVDRRYYLFLLKTNGSFHSKNMTTTDYSRFEEGDTFHLEKHRGLLGVGWITYR